MNRILELLSEFLGISHEASYKLVLTFATIVALALIQFLVLQLLLRNVSDATTKYKWSKTTRYIVMIVALILVGRIWFEGVSSVTTYLGLVSAGLVIVLREPVQDIAAFLYIVWRHPFRLGDRIEVNNVKGDVIDQSLFKFTLMEIGNWVDAEQSTGRVVHVPNHKVFVDNVYNYTGGFKYIWNEVTVRLTFESNYEKAKTLLQEIADRHTAELRGKVEQQVMEAASNYYLNYSKLTSSVYTEIKEYGICLTIRYLTEPRRRRATMQQIHEEVIRMLKAHHDIRWAYNTNRVFRSEVDGKDETWAGGIKYE